MKQFLSRKSVAEYFDTSPQTIDRWVRSGALPGPVQIGGSPRLDIDALLRSVVGAMNTQSGNRAAQQDAGRGATIYPASPSEDHGAERDGEAV